MENELIKKNKTATDNEKVSLIFLLVMVSSVVFVIINIFFYQLKVTINYFQFFSDSVMLLITVFLILLIQKQSTDKVGFYYYVYIGLTLNYFSLLILTLDNIYIYSDTIASISIKLLFVLGYSLLAIGISKWVRFNKNRQEELTIQANTDDLTGLLNRRSFTNFIEFEFINAKSHSKTFSLIILDIDYFKNINDSHGHMIGDNILKKLSLFMKSFFRNADKVCRWGGEEFAILLPNTNLKNAENVAEKIRIKIESIPFTSKVLTINYTVSLGISEWKKTDISVDRIINRADDALYLAKKSGRNCTRSISN